MLWSLSFPGRGRALVFLCVASCLGKSTSSPLCPWTSQGNCEGKQKGRKENMGMTGKSPPSSSPTSSGTNTFLGRFPGFDGGSGSSSGSRKQQECENPSTLKKSGSLEDIMKVSREFGDLQSLEDFGIKSEQEEQSHLAVSRSPRSPHLESPTCHPRFSRLKVITISIYRTQTPDRTWVAPAKISHVQPIVFPVQWQQQTPARVLR